MDLILQPLEGVSVGSYIERIFNDEFGEFDHFYAAVAFAKASGVRHIERFLHELCDNGGSISIIVGIDHRGTSIEALEMLLNIQSDQAKIIINHTEGDYITFHPKIYLFENDSQAIAIIGSNNLTEGGLFTNDEASFVLNLDLSKEEDKLLIDKLKQGLIAWSDEETRNARILTPELLQQLIAQGYIFSEEALQKSARQAEALLNQEVNSPTSNIEVLVVEKLFGKSAIKRLAPNIKRASRAVNQSPVQEVEPTANDVASFLNETVGFVMTLQKTDVGSGQTTPGTSRRSPEIFIPLAARDAHPEFWGWQELFTEDPKTSNKMDRLNVRIRIGGSIISVNMMTWPAKADFRIRSEALRSAGNIGDLIRIEKASDTAQFDYYVEIIPPGTSDYDHYLTACDHSTRNSSRRWGYYTI